MYKRPVYKPVFWDFEDNEDSYCDICGYDTV